MAPKQTQNPQICKEATKDHFDYDLHDRFYDEAKRPQFVCRILFGQVEVQSITVRNPVELILLKTGLKPFKYMLIGHSNGHCLGLQH